MSRPTSRQLALAIAAATLMLGGCSDDDAPSDDTPTTQADDQTPGSQEGDLDRNQGQQQDQTRPNDS